MKRLFAFIFYTLGIYILGVYSTRQYIYNETMGWWDWFLLSYFTSYFMVYLLINRNKND